MFDFGQTREDECIITENSTFRRRRLVDALAPRDKHFRIPRKSRQGTFQCGEKGDKVLRNHTTAQTTSVSRSVSNLQQDMEVCRIILCCLVFICGVSCQYGTGTRATIGRRAATPLVIEVLVVADYSSFNKWYELLDTSLTHTERVDIARQNLTTWLGTMVHTANIVYKGLEAHGLFISIKLVDLIIMTTVAASPWTETTKFKVNSTYMVDPQIVHPLFQIKSTQLQKTIPHDHAMLFTRYTMIHGRNGTTTIAGNAYLAAECKPKSQSIVDDSENMYTAQTIAHELGHSLGCEHDGDHNPCTVGAGYCMEAKYVTENKNKWTFSSCSINYIKNFVNKLNSHHTNCLARVDDNHAKSELGIATQQWVGKLYTADEQCVIAEGLGSHLCRGVYKGNFSEFCLNMYCNNPASGDCYTYDAGDGTPCASGSWCLSNECVHDHRAPLMTDEKCFAGDQVGVVYKQRTCKEIVKHSPNDCLRQDIKQTCCNSCTHAQTTSVPVDIQCQEEFGAGSYMCRNSHPYIVSTYSLICSELYCKNISTDSTCTAMEAYDKTSCGNKKWCQHGQCVADVNAPVVADDCPMGDHDNDPSVSNGNFTCAEIRHHKHNLECYSAYTARACCKTCTAIHRNIKGCEYGDKNKDCFSLISSSKDSHYCYTPGNADTCCESCNKYKNAANIGCEYGDKNQDCSTLITSRADSYNCYGINEDTCCGSCKLYQNTTNIGCEYGDKGKNCPSLISSRADSANCYSGHNADICCGSCGVYHDPSNTGCEYGDKLIGCSASACATLTAESKRGCCHSCRSSIIVG